MKLSIYLNVRHFYSFNTKIFQGIGISPAQNITRPHATRSPVQIIFRGKCRWAHVQFLQVWCLIFQIMESIFLENHACK